MFICTCFTCRRGSRRVGRLTKLRGRVCPLKKDPHGRGGRVGEGVGGSICCVLRRSEVLGGWICCVYEGLRFWEARFVVFYDGVRLWGGSGFNHAVRPGWSAKERPSRAWGGVGEGEGERFYL